MSRIRTIIINRLPATLRRSIEQRPGYTKILENIVWQFYDKVLRMGVGLLVGVWVARYLGPAQFGQFNYATAFVAMFSIIPGLGLNPIVVRDIVRDSGSINTTLGTTFILQLLAGFLAFLLVNVSIALLRPDDRFTLLIVAILSLSLIFKSTEVIKYWYESQVQTRYIVWIESGVFVLLAVTKVLMILVKAELIVFIWLVLIEALMVSIGSLAIYSARGGNFRKWKATVVRAKSLLGNSWPLLLSSLAVIIYMRVDVLMLAEMTNSREVGIYTAATRISEVFHFLPLVIVSSVSPSIIRSHTEDRDQGLKRLGKLYSLLAWLAIGISLTICVLSGKIVAVLYGNAYSEAAPVLAIHLWAIVAVFLGTASSQYLLVEQLLRISLYRTLIGLVCNVAANLFLIPRLGALGAAISAVIAYFVATFSLVFFKPTRKHAVFMMLAPFVKH